MEFAHEEASHDIIMNRVQLVGQHTGFASQISLQARCIPNKFQQYACSRPGHQLAADV
jgi:hypothetical protein